MLFSLGMNTATVGNNVLNGISGGTTQKDVRKN